MTASTTASQSTPKPVRSSPPGTLRCARAMSDAWRLAAPAVSAALVVPLLPEAQLPVPSSQEPELPALVPPVLAHLVVDSALLPDLLSRLSSSVAMARSSPLPGPATY